VISIPKNVATVIKIINIKNHMNHCEATLNKEPLSIPFHGMKVYVANVTRIKNNNRLVSVILYPTPNNVKVKLIYDFS
tara:strand:+ start:23 stop:256 length:234 start_codon:yes stop_codon:yes gene_type:complete